MRATWILGDAHGGADAMADRALVALLEQAAAARVDLLIMGDLFLGWIALERFFTPLQREVIARLRALREAGGRVDFVAGNRDYLAGELAGTAFDRVLEGEVVLELGGVPTLVTHGDRLVPGDVLYHAWRRVSRAQPVSLALRALPGPAGRALARRTERALAGTNLRYKTGALPLDALAALGRRAQAAGAKRAVVGHFHHDRSLDVAGGVPVIVAPGWVEHRRVLVAEPGAAVLTSCPAEQLPPPPVR